MARRIAYDPDSGQDYLVQVSFTPDDARKLIEMAKASHTSVRDVLRIFVQEAEIDRSGRSLLVDAAHRRRADEETEGAGLF